MLASYQCGLSQLSTTTCGLQVSTPSCRNKIFQSRTTVTLYFKASFQFVHNGQHMYLSTYFKYTGNPLLALLKKHKLKEHHGFEFPKILISFLFDLSHQPEQCDWLQIYLDFSILEKTRPESVSVNYRYSRKCLCDVYFTNLDKMLNSPYTAENFGCYMYWINKPTRAGSQLLKALSKSGNLYFGFQMKLNMY